MRLTKLGHACLLVEVQDARLPIDPGTFSHGFAALRGLTGVPITHQHGDHLDPARIQAVAEANPDTAVVADAAVTIATSRSCPTSAFSSTAGCCTRGTR
jgi:Predicted Zn-dependent hydrolases of the beta-lactamase fold